MTEQFTEGTVKIIKEDDTFFNPAQKLNRDISAAVIQAYFGNRENIRILTSMSATGLRGICYLNEIPQSRLFFNDICPKAIETIQRNLKFNGFEEFKLFNGSDDLRQGTERINITLSDCHVLMHKYHGYFDVIDIDPFGSCAEFVNSAFKAIKHNGLICFTCTDKAALCTNQSKCFIKYNAVIRKLHCKNETPIRTLLGYVSREAAKYGAKIVPILSVSVDFYVRVIVRVYKGQEKSVLKDNSYMCICDCLNRVEIPFNTPVPSICDACEKSMVLYGPFWNKAIHDTNVIEQILSTIQEEGNERMVGILRLMKQELPDMFYYEIPNLSSKFKINCCKIKDILNALTNANYKASLTHCDNNAFKTDASIQIIRDVLMQWSSGASGGFSFEPNEYVTELLDQQYYKGQVRSGLRPLSLPRK